MRVWLISCVLLFILVELYKWIQQFLLPFPVYVVAGAFLAIASNYNRGIGSFFNAKANSPTEVASLLTEQKSSLED